jgi:Domain of unknown function (DUF1905)/Bacteriocin-protection, YdeI or OmpD-Associated
MEKPLVNKKYLLHKYPGKGGWIYALIPDIEKNRRGKFGSIRVKGTIDGFEIKQYTLMPWKDHGMFLPVKAEIRKKIGKTEGDTVHIKLYKDDSVFEIPDELTMCLMEEPEAYRFFLSLSQSEQRLYVVWIFGAKRVETRTNRIVKSIERLLQKKKLYERDEKEF